MTMNENAPPGTRPGGASNSRIFPRYKTGDRTGRVADHQAGGGDRDRTGDLKLAKLALSQLSYAPRSSRTGARYAAIT